MGPLHRTAWAGSEITPPPALEGPEVRVPLERARELEDRADSEESAEAADRCLREALDWLEHPHPRSSPALLRAVHRKKRSLRSRLGST